MLLIIPHAGSARNERSLPAQPVAEAAPAIEEAEGDIVNCLTVTDFGGLDVGIPQAMRRSIDFAANSHGIGAG